MQHTTRPDSGIFISVEGIDGAGKSSLIKSLSNHLSQLTKRNILLTKEPGGSILGTFLRKLLQEQPMPIYSKAEFLLFAADRAQHVQEVIKPALAQGDIVITDRFIDSSLAYQGYGRGLDIDILRMINTWAIGDCIPDCTLYLKLDPQIALDRCVQRQEKITIFEQEKKEFFERLATGYDILFKHNPHAHILNAQLPPEQVAQEALHCIKPLINIDPC